MSAPWSDGPFLSVDTWKWLADPGIEIPAQATSIHGITTEHARMNGRPEADVAGELRDVMHTHWMTGRAVIIMNAPYDLAVLRRALAEHWHEPLDIGDILDPLAIDRACVPKRSGKGVRTLTALATAYRVEQGAAHSADGDALTAARVLWRQIRAHRLDRMTLAETQTWQARAHLSWADELGAYFASVGRADDVGRAWPIGPAPAGVRP